MSTTALFVVTIFLGLLLQGVCLADKAQAYAPPWFPPDLQRALDAVDTLERQIYAPNKSNHPPAKPQTPSVGSFGIVAFLVVGIGLGLAIFRKNKKAREELIISISASVIAGLIITGITGSVLGPAGAVGAGVTAGAGWEGYKLFKA